MYDIKKSGITAWGIGHFAAMIFAKELVKVDYNPFILDILLFFDYNKTGAESIFEDVMKIANDE